MANLPFVGSIGTKGALRNMEEERDKKDLALARADIAIARVHGTVCRDFLRNAEHLMESGHINPGEVCELVDRCYKGYSPALLHSALSALTKVSSRSTAQQIMTRVDQKHQVHGASATDVGVPRLLHPAGG